LRKLLEQVIKDASLLKSTNQTVLDGNARLLTTLEKHKDKIEPREYQRNVTNHRKLVSSLMNARNTGVDITTDPAALKEFFDAKGAKDQGEEIDQLKKLLEQISKYSTTLSTLNKVMLTSNDALLSSLEKHHEQIDPEVIEESRTVNRHIREQLQRQQE
jgi:hypothetical protein